MTEPMGGANRRRSGGRMVGVGPSGSVEEQLAEIAARLERLETTPGLRARGRSVVNRVMPPEAGTHFRNAGREQLLGIRSIVDFWIDRLDAAERKAASEEHGRETIEIE